MRACAVYFYGLDSVHWLPPPLSATLRGSVTREQWDRQAPNSHRVATEGGMGVLCRAVTMYQLCSHPRPSASLEALPYSLGEDGPGHMADESLLMKHG